MCSPAVVRGTPPVGLIKPFAKFFDRHRLSDEVPLGGIASEGIERVPLGLRFDAFRDDRKIQVMRQFDRRTDDHGGSPVVDHPGNEGLVDLQRDHR